MDLEHSVLQSSAGAREERWHVVLGDSLLMNCLAHVLRHYEIDVQREEALHMQFHHKFEKGRDSILFFLGVMISFSCGDVISVTGQVPITNKRPQDLSSRTLSKYGATVVVLGST